MTAPKETPQQREPADEGVWELSAESEAVANPPPRWHRLIPRGLVGWLYVGVFALLVWMLIGSLSGAGGSGAAGDGQIVFGTGVDVSSHDITGERSTFRVGDTFAYRAYLSEQVPASELLIRATQTKTDGSQEVSNFPGPSSSAGANAITSSAASQLTDKDVGHWKLEILHGDSVVARGEFSVEAAGG